MATTIHQRETSAGRAARLTTEQVWHQVAKASFAVLSHVTPAGAPRSSLGVSLLKMRSPVAARAGVPVTPARGG